MLRYFTFGLLMRRWATAAAFTAVLSSAAIVALSVVRAEDPQGGWKELQLTQATGEPLGMPQKLDDTAEGAQRLLSPVQCAEMEEIERIRQQLVRPLEGTLFQQVSNTADSHATLTEFAETYLRVASEAIASQCLSPCDRASTCETKCEEGKCHKVKQCSSCETKKECANKCGCEKKCGDQLKQVCKKDCAVQCGSDCAKKCGSCCEVSKKCPAEVCASKKCGNACQVVAQGEATCGGKKCGLQFKVVKLLGCVCDKSQKCDANCNCKSGESCCCQGSNTKVCSKKKVKHTGEQCECSSRTQAITISFAGADAELVNHLRSSARMLEMTAADLEDAQDFARADRLRRLAQELRLEARGSSSVTARAASGTPR